MAQNSDFSKSGNCTLCGKKSESKCDRCGDFYCSEACQRKDWPGHRFICFPMPKLVKVGQSSTVNNSELRKESPSPPELAAKHPQPEIQAKDPKSSQNTNPLPNGSCILLTSFNSTNRCYIRSTNPSIVAEHEKILKEIDEFGKKSIALSEKPKPNSYALALKNQKWYRVQILGNSRDKSYLISFIDCGDISKRSLKELRRIEPSLINLPIFVHKVQLNGVKNYSNSPEVLKSLVPYTNKEYKVEFLKADKGYVNVKLFQWGSSILLNSIIQNLSFKQNNEKDDDVDHVSVTSSSNSEQRKDVEPDKKEHAMETTEINKNKISLKHNLNGNTNEKSDNAKSSTSERNIRTNKVETNGDSELITTNYENKRKTSAPRQIQMRKPCLVPPFDIIPLNENDSGSLVRIIDCSYIDGGYIGCLVDEYLENMKEVSKFLSEYNVGDQSYKPKFNEYCLAKFENEWYRAKVVEVLADDKFLVVYIDFTNEMELTSDSIRYYPQSLTLPCRTTLCAIDGLPEDISKEQKQFLEMNCIPFQTALKIDSVRIAESIRYVKSNALLNKMRNSNLL